jgi:quercetin dioxygenase-like cupin family protein
VGFGITSLSIQETTMYTKTFHSNSIDWQPSGIDGVTFKSLDGDMTTGKSVVVYHFDAGSVVPAHSHTQSDELGYVLDGDFIENGVSYHSGSVFAAPAGTVHGEHRTQTGCTVMFVLSDTLDFIPA